MARAPKIAPNRNALHPFDRKYGTDTGGYLSPDDLRGGATSDAMNNGYSAVGPSVFRVACRRWRETLLSSTSRLEAYTFVDVGAGKGRALLLAAESPFRKVIGVELNEELARIARRNIIIWKRTTRSRGKIRVLEQDALDFRWPRAPLLVYLNNPFECELVEKLAARLASLAASGPGLVDLLYVNPACADTLTKNGNFELLWNAQIQMDEADQQADPYGAASDRVAAFRFRTQRPGGNFPRPTARAPAA
ncbi:MAG: class I SAM-dependent methyltransferase [Acidobacteriia bacterium]|nr:class I SAM-dependent methyltransferase [Terriglobia bacterium]